jgi:hypothetical protein
LTLKADRNEENRLDEWHISLHTTHSLRKKPFKPIWQISTFSKGFEKNYQQDLKKNFKTV